MFFNERLSFVPSVTVSYGEGWFELTAGPYASKAKAKAWLDEKLFSLSQDKAKIKNPCIRVDKTRIYPIQGEGVQGVWQDL